MKNENKKKYNFGACDNPHERAEISRHQLKSQVTQRILDRVDQTPRSYQLRYLRAVSGHASAKAAIRAKCFDCVGYENPKENMQKSLCETCPLVCFRPYQGN